MYDRRLIVAYSSSSVSHSVAGSISRNRRLSAVSVQSSPCTTGCKKKTDRTVMHELRTTLAFGTNDMMIPHKINLRGRCDMTSLSRLRTPVQRRLARCCSVSTAASSGHACEVVFERLVETPVEFVSEDLCTGVALAASWWQRRTVHSCSSRR